MIKMNILLGLLIGGLILSGCQNDQTDRASKNESSKTAQKKQSQCYFKRQSTNQKNTHQNKKF
jgi:hypothetical protein